MIIITVKIWLLDDCKRPPHWCVCNPSFRLSKSVFYAKTGGLFFLPFSEDKESIPRRSLQGRVIWLRRPLQVHLPLLSFLHQLH